MNSVENMRNAIMATLDHYCSMDKEPRHDNCPVDDDTWCEWRKAEASNSLKSYKYPPRLISPDVESSILPIYKDLCRGDLLTRFLGGGGGGGGGGGAQNANESFKATVWRMAPKHLSSGKKIVEIAAHIAAGLFNGGYGTVFMTMGQLKLNIGHQCKIFADHMDNIRVARADRRHSDSTKEARSAHREAQLIQNEYFEEAEGSIYEPGGAD